jgi:hypothetical protein
MATARRMPCLRSSIPGSSASFGHTASHRFELGAIDSLAAGGLRTHAVNSAIAEHPARSQRKRDRCARTVDRRHLTIPWRGVRCDLPLARLCPPLALAGAEELGSRAPGDEVRAASARRWPPQSLQAIACAHRAPSFRDRRRARAQGAALIPVDQRGKRNRGCVAIATPIRRVQQPIERQGYHGISDAEAVEVTVVDLRWQNSYATGAPTTTGAR